MAKRKDTTKPTPDTAAARLSPEPGEAGGGEHAAPVPLAEMPLYGNPEDWNDPNFDPANNPAERGQEGDEAPETEAPAGFGPPRREPGVASRSDHRPGSHAPVRDKPKDLPPLPAYLRPLVEHGAFEEHELRAVGHRTARLRLEGDKGTGEMALAHLAPDALATIRRKAGAGHVTGTIIPADGPALAFALYIEPAPGEEPEEADPRDLRIAALERRLSEPRQKTELERLGEQIAIDALSKALNPPDPIEQLERLMQQAGQLAGLPGKIKGQLGPLLELITPAVQAQVEQGEAPGWLSELFQKGVHWAMEPGNIARLIQIAKGQFPAEDMFVDGEVA